MSHLSQEELNARIDTAKQQVEIGAFYIHYKSPENRYLVKDIGLLEESDAPCIIYQSQSGETGVV